VSSFVDQTCEKTGRWTEKTCPLFVNFMQLVQITYKKNISHVYTRQVTSTPIKMFTSILKTKPFPKCSHDFDSTTPTLKYPNINTPCGIQHNNE